MITCKILIISNSCDAVKQNDSEVKNLAFSVFYTAVSTLKICFYFQKLQTKFLQKDKKQKGNYSICLAIFQNAKFKTSVCFTGSGTISKVGRGQIFEVQIVHQSQVKLVQQHQQLHLHKKVGCLRVIALQRVETFFWNVVSFKWIYLVHYSSTFKHFIAYLLGVFYFRIGWLKMWMGHAPQCHWPPMWPPSHSIPYGYGMMVCLIT